MVSRNLYKTALKEARDEITDYTIYTQLSKNETNTNLRNVFYRISKMEHVHYLFWMNYCKDASISPDAIKVKYVVLLRRVMGASFIVKYLEGSETAAIAKYESMRSIIPKADKNAFEDIIKDEEKHEQAFAGKIEGGYVKYISFIVLGLADALVEIAGIHAGSLGIYNSTLLTGLAGIVAGAAASLSMASAAYAQAKQGYDVSAKTAAAYTGISYFVSAVILASPYFFTDSMPIAIFSSLVLGMCIIAFVSWYNSIISGSKFRKDFSELAGIMLGATVVLFILGLVIRQLFGITI